MMGDGDSTRGGEVSIEPIQSAANRVGVVPVSGGKVTRWLIICLMVHIRQAKAAQEMAAQEMARFFEPMKADPDNSEAESKP